MKVGYFVETPVEHNLTGGVRSFLNLVEQLIPMGVEPYVVVSEPWALTEKLEEMGIPFITAKMFRPFVGVEDHVRFEREKYWIKTIINDHAKIKAIRWFRKNGVQLVHINSQFAGVVGAQVAKALNIPYVYHIREFLEEHFGVQFYSESLLKNFVASADSIVGISKAVQAYYTERFGRKVELIYNGLPCSEENCFNFGNRFRSAVINMAITGRVTVGKGQWEAVKAVELLVNQYGQRNICLHIIGFTGKDSYELSLKQYVEEQGLAEFVVFHQFTNKPEEILKDCDIGLTCSAAEAFGRITVEYMLAGLFTIGTNNGGTPEIILDGETGLLYTRGNEEELAEKMHWVLQNREKAVEMLTKGQKRAREFFSILATACNVHALYKTLL